MQESLGSFINGQFITAGQVKPFISPVSGEEIAQIAQAGSSEIEQAIRAADDAFAHWKRSPASERANVLRNMAKLMREQKIELAKLMTLEMGKPIRESRGEVEYAASFFDWFAGEAERCYGLIIPSSKSNKQLSILYQPLGVCGVITPWNFPLAMPARKVAAALAAGCTIVMKPSPETPISGLRLAEIAIAAGLPAGVLNCVIGNEEVIGSALTKSPVVRKISFTGSCAVGQFLYSASAPTMKKLTMELGGNAPVIVFDDVEIDAAVDGVIATKFRNSGQTCICANRIFVQRPIYELFVRKLAEKVGKLRVGDPREEATEISTILHPASQTKVQEFMADAKNKGARIVLDAKALYEPRIVCEVSSEMRLFNEEVFAPIAALSPFEADEEGIFLANQSQYGLAAYVFTRQLARAHRAVEELHYGIIGVNDPRPSCAQASFGGLLQSGLGREGGPTGLREYLAEKYISKNYH